MKAMFFDAGPIITLVMSRLSGILPELKKSFGGDFYITPAVKFELIDRPLTIKRFELEALEVMRMVREGILTVYENVPQKRVKELKDLANSSFRLKNKTLDVLQAGEVESVASALDTKSSMVMDERTLRLFIENYRAMKSLLERRNKSKVIADEVKMKKFSTILRDVPIIRSIELVSIAYKMGFLNSYVPPRKYGKNILVDAVLWATKFNGCAVTEHEIEEIKQVLL